jgi:alginate O-acetyltransferase complex protein AlgI
MTFDSLTFIVFLLALLLAYHLPGLSWTGRKWLLLLASWVFYGAVESTLSAAYWWVQPRSTGGWRSAWMQHRAERVSIGCGCRCSANLGVLGFFKYGDFLRDNTQWLLARSVSIGSQQHSTSCCRSVFRSTPSSR